RVESGTGSRRLGRALVVRAEQSSQPECVPELATQPVDATRTAASNRPQRATVQEWRMRTLEFKLPAVVVSVCQAFGPGGRMRHKHAAHPRSRVDHLVPL